MKRIYIAFLLLAAISFSCTDLTEEPYDVIPGDLYPENEAQIASLAVDAYKPLQNIIDDGGWWFWAQEVTSDELVFPTRGADWDDGGKWRVMHSHTWTNDIEGVNRQWSAYWDGIIRSNKILDKLRSFPESEILDKKIAEVEVMRSFYYYLLIDNYGDVPYLESAADAPDQPEKVSREEIFNNITNLIEDRLPDLKLIDNKLMATRYMAFSMLAKLYMNAEIYTGTPQFEKAEQYIDSVIAGPYALESSVTGPFATDNESSPEIIFSVNFDEDLYQGFRIHMRTLHYQHNLTYNMNVGPWNGCAVTKQHFDTYEDGDLRKEAYFIWGPQFESNGNQIIESVTGEPLDINPEIPALVMDASYTPTEVRTTGARISKYEIAKGAKENLSNDFPLFRLTDFYLMKAECAIRLRGDGSGDEWINPIRTRAAVEDMSGATLEMLLAERGREMFAEGHRRQDLIRFGEFNKSWWEKAATGSERNTFPIPQWAVDANPNLAN